MVNHFEWQKSDLQFKLLYSKCYVCWHLRATNNLQKLSKISHDCVPYPITNSLLFMGTKKCSSLEFVMSGIGDHSLVWTSSNSKVFNSYDRNLRKLRCFLQKLRRVPSFFQLSFQKLVSIKEFFFENQRSFGFKDIVSFEDAAAYNVYLIHVNTSTK